MENKAFEIWEEYRKQDSILFEELLKENKKLNDYGK